MVTFSLLFLLGFFCGVTIVVSIVSTTSFFGGGVATLVSYGAGSVGMACSSP
jgi:hypothetical protein